MILQTTLVAAALGALTNLWLASRIVRRRFSTRTMNGDGGDPALAVTIRAQANYVEYAPFVLILVAAIELSAGPSVWLWGIVAVFTLARIAHPIGMDRPAPNVFRAGGIMLTWLALVILAIWALAIALEAGRSGPARAIPTESIVPAG